MPKGFPLAVGLQGSQGQHGVGNCSDLVRRIWRRPPPGRKMLAAGAELWHKGTMETGLGLASREALLAIIAEQQWVISGQQGAIAELRQRVEAWRPGCPAADREPGCRGINRPPGARSRERSVSTASHGRGWHPPGGWSTPRSLAPNAIPP